MMQHFVAWLLPLSSFGLAAAFAFFYRFPCEPRIPVVDLTNTIGGRLLLCGLMEPVGFCGYFLEALPTKRTRDGVVYRLMVRSCNSCGHQCILTSRGRNLSDFLDAAETFIRYKLCEFNPIKGYHNSLPRDETNVPFPKEELIALFGRVE
jgi:hypothetical protein